MKVTDDMNKFRAYSEIQFQRRDKKWAGKRAARNQVKEE